MLDSFQNDYSAEHASLKEGANLNHNWEKTPMPGYLKSASQNIRLMSQTVDSDGAIIQKYSTDPSDLEELE